MSPERFRAITSRYPELVLAVVGDFCLDRYMEIDPTRQEISIETGLPVHNVVRVRSQPGGAGTIVNNLSALGVREIVVIGFAGWDGEGFELRQALRQCPGVNDDLFLQTSERRTFTYCKPLVLREGQAPEELNRLDSKNWDTTPPSVETKLIGSLRRVFSEAQGVILLDQVDQADTGVITQGLLGEIGSLRAQWPECLVLADSRRGMRGFPPVGMKMNLTELAAMTGQSGSLSREQVRNAVVELAQETGQPVIVTMAEQGMLGCDTEGGIEYVEAFPLRGPIDIVGAGDAVTANLMAARAAGATLRESMELASAAASLVIHQLGTTGAATVAQLRSLLVGSP